MPITKKDLVTAKFLTLIIFSVFGAVTGFVLGIAGGVVFKSSISIPRKNGLHSWQWPV